MRQFCCACSKTSHAKSESANNCLTNTFCFFKDIVSLVYSLGYFRTSSVSYLEVLGVSGWLQNNRNRWWRCFLCLPASLKCRMKSCLIDESRQAQGGDQEPKVQNSAVSMQQVTCRNVMLFKVSLYTADFVE